MESIFEKLENRFYDAIETIKATFTLYPVMIPLIILLCYGAILNNLLIIILTIIAALLVPYRRMV